MAAVDLLGVVAGTDPLAIECWPAGFYLAAAWRLASFHLAASLLLTIRPSSRYTYFLGVVAGTKGPTHSRVSAS